MNHHALEESKGVKILLQVVLVLDECNGGQQPVQQMGLLLSLWLQLLSALHTSLHMQAACLRLLASSQAAWLLAA